MLEKGLNKKDRNPLNKAAFLAALTLVALSCLLRIIVTGSRTVMVFDLEALFQLLAIIIYCCNYETPLFRKDSLLKDSLFNHNNR